MSFRRPSTFLQGIAIVLLGMAAGLGANQISPRGIPLFPPPQRAAETGEFIALAQAKRLWDGGAALFLDAREPDDYAAGHIGNALNLPAQSFAGHFGEVAPMLTPASELVLYCDGKECELSHRLAENLRQQGFTNLHILANGWTVWREAGLPATTGGRK